MAQSQHKHLTYAEHLNILLEGKKIGKKRTRRLWAHIHKCRKCANDFDRWEGIVLFQLPKDMGGRFGPVA